MKINTIHHTALIGLIALALLPSRAWGQADARIIQADEIGQADYRISTMGPEGNINFDALHPTIVFNSTNQEFLVVWAGDNVMDGDVEIFGQRLDAEGIRTGQAFQISNMGGDSNPAFDAVAPSVAFDSANNEYLVVWQGTTLEGNVAVFGQRLNAETGEALGNDDFQISDAHARQPSVTYNSTDNEYFIVWQGAEDGSGMSILGRRLDAATGQALGTDVIRISHADPMAQAFDARRPTIAYNTDHNEYLVAWESEEALVQGIRGASEIFGRRLNASGEALGTEAIRISHMGPDGDTAFDAAEPALTYNQVSHEYFVAWVGDSNENGLVDNEFEVFGRRISTDGEALGNDMIRISHMGPDGNPAFDAALPTVVFNPEEAEYLVAWRGDQATSTLVAGAKEIFGRRISTTGEALGDEMIRISHMGETDEDTRFGAIQTAITLGTNNRYMAVWNGDDQIDNEHEVYGRLFQGSAVQAIELANFQASVDAENTAVLSWETTEVIANARFEVQHKIIDAFETVAEVTGSPETPGQYSYRASALAPGTHTFRIKQSTADGSAAYSAEVEAIIEAPNGFLLSNAYPNPFNQNATFSLTLNERQHVELALYDMLGRRVAVIHDGDVEAHQATSFRINGEGLSSGYYFIRVVGKTFVDSQQVLVVR